MASNGIYDLTDVLPDLDLLEQISPHPSPLPAGERDGVRGNFNILDWNLELT